jgi:Peptidase family M1 domain
MDRLRHALLTAVFGSIAAATPGHTQTQYDSVFDQLKALAPASSRAAVKALVLRRDVMELRLDSGFAYVLTPVAGRTVGIAFLGSGSLSFEPPIGVEQYNVRRVFGDSTVSGPITAAVFIFADSTGEELRHRLSFATTESARSGDVGDAVGDAIDFLVDGHTHTADPSLLAAVLNHETTAFFSAYIKRAHGESVMIQYDPEQVEQVALYRRGHMVGQRIETVCQFPRIQDMAANVPITSVEPEALTVAGYDIDATIDNNYKFAARTIMRVVARRDGQQWAPLLLYSELHVDSATTGSAGDQPLTTYRRDRQTAMWVRFDKPLMRGDTAIVRLAYHGRLIEFGSAMEEFLPPWWDQSRRQIAPVMDSWAFIKETETWYPRYSLAAPRSFPVSLTFHTPAKLKFATIGRLVSADTVNDVMTTHWISELPTDQVSFNIGQFEEFDIRDPRIPPVTVHFNTEAHRAMSRLLPHISRPEEQVGADVANSLAFFTKMFGPALFHEYTATEIPYFHGQAFPGMIHLSWWTFMGLSSEGTEEVFRAHEMAHQWWGIGVEPASYRDAWLSEGFAEFAGMWYMQTILHDNEKYLKRLRRSRDEIRRQRGKAAPIGLGWRAAESWRGNYALTTYQKGAWVLQMLRNMMLDPRTMGEERFQAMMRDFYQTYRGKRATTLDFQHAVERHIGQPMDWFFDEWVYGTDVPTYTFAWKATPDSGGKTYTARVRVRQTDVPDNFGMYVPLLIKFDEGEALVRILVRGPSTEGVVHLPAEPRSMELNPLESVLADVKTEGWE